MGDQDAGVQGAGGGEHVVAGSHRDGVGFIVIGDEVKKVHTKKLRIICTQEEFVPGDR